MQVTGTAALVTGGASGLGAATAAALAAGGATVFALDLPAALEAAPAVDGVTYVAADVTDAGRSGRRRPGCRVRGAAAPRGELRGHRPLGPDPGPQGRPRPRRCTPRWSRSTWSARSPCCAWPPSRSPRTEPDDAGPARRDRQHRLDRGVRRAGRPGRLRLLQGRRRRPDAARGPRPGPARHPGQHDRPRDHGARPCWPPVSRRVPRPRWPAAVPFPQRLGRPDEYAQLVLMPSSTRTTSTARSIRLDGALRMAPR